MWRIKGIIYFINLDHQSLDVSVVITIFLSWLQSQSPLIFFIILFEVLEKNIQKEDSN